MQLTKLFLFLFLLCSSSTLLAQSDSSIQHDELPRFSFQPVIQLGVMEGAQGTGLQLGMVGGFQRKTWYAGLGTGLDYYGFRSIPLYATLRKTLLKPKALFVYADAGLHFPWVKINEETQWYESDFKSGSYYDAGVGYGFKVAKNSTLQVSLGYSQKRLKEDRKQVYIWGPPGMPTYTERYDYTYRRLSIKAGWMF